MSLFETETQVSLTHLDLLDQFSRHESDLTNESSESAQHITLMGLTLLTNTHQTNGNIEQKHDIQVVQFMNMPNNNPPIFLNSKVEMDISRQLSESSSIPIYITKKSAVNTNVKHEKEISADYVYAPPKLRKSFMDDLKINIEPSVLTSGASYGQAISPLPTIHSNIG